MGLLTGLSSRIEIAAIVSVALVANKSWRTRDVHCSSAGERGTVFAFY